MYRRRRLLQEQPKLQRALKSDCKYIKFFLEEGDRMLHWGMQHPVVFLNGKMYNLFSMIFEKKSQR